MSSEYSFEEKGKVRRQKPQSEKEPEKAAPRSEAERRPPEGDLDAGTLTQLQQTIGNAAVQRYLAQRSGDGPAEVEEETAKAINEKRGGGQALDDEMAAKAGAVMDHDFDDVRVHTDSQADQLSRSLGAEAFTTGKDIFFREGSYDPASSEGQELLSHELTHVAQQSESSPAPGRMTVNDPDDHFEAEADAVADTVTSQPGAGLSQRQEVEEEEEVLQRQAVEEEEEMLQMQELEEEEELLQGQDEMTQMQEMEEEEEVLS